MPSIADKPLPADADRRTPASPHPANRALRPRGVGLGSPGFLSSLWRSPQAAGIKSTTPTHPLLRRCARNPQYTRPEPIQPDETLRDREPVPVPEGRPEFVETGMASWYGPSGHRAADGSAYDGTGMTAAHKTLPLGTVARVTNLANGESVMVRITDRGPFSHGRILDLSESAAKKIDLYRMGVAQVRIEAFANATCHLSKASGACKPAPSKPNRMRSISRAPWFAATSAPASSNSPAPPATGFASIRCGTIAQKPPPSRTGSAPRCRRLCPTSSASTDVQSFGNGGGG